jgi:hypothetical protein
MPVFEVEANGRQFEIEAPDMQAASAALSQHLGSSQTAAPAPAGENSLAGSAKAIGSGLAEGVTGLAGLPADAIDLATRGIDYVAGTNLHERVGKTASDYAGGQAMQGYLEKATGPLYKPQTTSEEYLRTGFSFAPAMIGGGGSLAMKAATRVALPAIASETAGQVTKGTEMEPYMRVAGGLAGAAIPLGVARAISPSAIGAERQAALTTLRNEGVDAIPASMATGSKTLKAMESELGGARYANAVERTNEQFTAAALRRAGIQGETRLTPDVLNAAEDRIGNVFNTLAARNPVIQMDVAASRQIAAAADDYANLTNQRSQLLDNFVQRLHTGGGPALSRLSGAEYQAMRSEISRFSRASAQPELRHALRDVQAALDAGVGRALRRAGNHDDARVWTTARRQWYNTMVLERTVNNSTEAAAQGFITPAKLQTAIKSMSKGNYARGRGDFADLARAGNQIIKPLADSGTASRARAHAVPALAGAVLGGGMGVVPGALAALAGPMVAGPALMSRPVQRYLTNQRAAPFINNNDFTPDALRAALLSSASMPQLGHQ